MRPKQAVKKKVKPLLAPWKWEYAVNNVVSLDTATEACRAKQAAFLKSLHQIKLNNSLPSFFGTTKSL
jgi:hypothetical protein